MNLLITGGAGFIGSNFILYMLEKHEDIRIINLDKLTYAGNLDHLKAAEKDPRYFFVKGDICDQSLVKNLFTKYCIDGVIHFAAESHVDNSIKNPQAFIETNVGGTATLLEAARQFWMNDANAYQSARFLHISTDEVFGTLGEEGFFTEDTPYAPNSPYSASKAASDLLVRSYFHTFNMNVVTTNCSNNFGPRQHEEKLIPTIIRKALALEKIPIYGSGKNIRDWIYIHDHCRALEKVFFDGKIGDSYVIGGHNEKSNIEIALEICGILDDRIPITRNEQGIISYQQLIEFVEDRPGHDYRYAIDDAKIRKQLGFRPTYDFKKGMEETIAYFLLKENAYDVYSI
ncbi:dTDP-glucose 4,6-dehydratase [Cytobacillus eiseniae]|uniref:dTDP-glucose 4,6-dehydratase n=1 Tax=Cytobacillus eiseniae TaxID=762947 RepID=A0ABS4RHS2_9BACI|nr:dTDP-glucose 4,6-dehydratase [Cytobacillus eiseniae]MBP2241859.1 dTDP-glucose 4,6-dehydratase [Cytobacillus eiseniae]